jgi:putative Holliday junction resolvase
VRVLGIDLGRRRIGLAISDPSGTLARPLLTLTGESPARAGGYEDPVTIESAADTERPSGSAWDPPLGGPAKAAVERVAREVERLAAEDDGLEAVVVGVPSRLDGTASAETAYAKTFIKALQERTAIPVIGQDERLTSREAESRLALRERDWKKRKARLDAAAAAVILQDYLDRH